MKGLLIASVLLLVAMPASAVTFSYELRFGTNESTNATGVLADFGSGNLGTNTATASVDILGIPGASFDLNLMTNINNIDIGGGGFANIGGVQGNRLGPGETGTLTFINNASGLPPGQTMGEIRILEAAFGSSNNNRLGNGETATFLTSQGISGTIIGTNSTNAFISLSTPATLLPGESITFGLLTDTNGFKVRRLAIEIDINDSIPEPTTATLAMMGLGGLFMRRRRAV